MDAKTRKLICNEQIAAGKCGWSELDCLYCEFMYNEHEIDLEAVINEAKRDPKTKEHGAVVYWHSGVHRYVYFCDEHLKCDAEIRIPKENSIQ